MSGWGIFESERNAGELGLVAHGPFVFASGDPAFYLTGLATLISGLSLAGLTVVFIALGALSPRFQRRGRPPS